MHMHVGISLLNIPVGRKVQKVCVSAVVWEQVWKTALQKAWVTTLV